jgi:acyl dehydratase
MPTLATGLDELRSLAGADLGASGWLEISQQRVDTFADATGDHQWIHVDVERAKAGPFGGTIAHGYLTLSLIPMLSSRIFAVETPGARLNYGLNKVRFPTPVRVGARIRGRASLVALADVPAGKQLTCAFTIEVEGEPKPACVAETVVLLLS